MPSQLVQWSAAAGLSLLLLAPPQAAAQDSPQPGPAAGDSAAVAAAPANGDAEAAAPATAEAPADPFTMRIGARVQARYGHTMPHDGDAHGAIGIQRARLSATGDAYQRFQYALQLELAGERARLIDANVRVPIAPLAEIWVGQGKTPFGRQQLNSSGNLQFVDRSIANSRFTHGRDFGVMLQGQTDRFGYNAGLFNGEGLATSANPGGKFMPVGRVYLTPFGAYNPSESAFDFPATPRLALGVSAMHNPVGDGDLRTDITRLGFEAAFKLRGMDLLGEYFTESAEVGGAGLDTNGWHAQLGYLLPGGNHSLAGRYAVVNLLEDAGQVETGIAYSYYLQQHRAKIQADFRNISLRPVDTNTQQLRVQLQLTM